MTYKIVITPVAQKHITKKRQASKSGVLLFYYLLHNQDACVSVGSRLLIIGKLIKI